MRILYGVTGEGMGHATRSKVVCEHLVAQGHELKIVASGRAHGFLAKTFHDVVEIAGLTIKYVDNAMDRDATLGKNLLAAPSMLHMNATKYFADVARFGPQLVITDFDSYAWFFAKRHGIPIVSIDNQQIIVRCKHPKEIKKGARVDYEMTKAFVRAKTPGCDHYVITTFFKPQIKHRFEGATTLVPPILRRAILDAKPHARRRDHVLVYQTSKSDTSLVPTLGSLKGERFIVYGFGKDEKVGNVTMKQFSEEGFVADLAQSKAVVANGGLSLLGEAVYLGKPIFSVPVRHQYEQVMNARYVEKLGYGVQAKAIEKDALKAFLDDGDKFAVHLLGHKQKGNEKLYETVDRLVRRLTGR